MRKTSVVMKKWHTKLAISRPGLDLTLNYLRDATETVNYGYLHGCPYNQHRNNEHYPFEIRSHIGMLIGWWSEMLIKQMVVESA